MPATWFFKSRGPHADQDYTWQPAGAGTAAVAHEIVRDGYDGRPCFDLVDDELPSLLLYGEHGRLVLVVTALMPPGSPADSRQRPIRVTLLGVADAGDEAGCRALTGVAAAALLDRLAGDLPMRYGAAEPHGFSVGGGWPDVAARAGRRLTSLAELAPPADARDSVLAPDTEQFRRDLAAELADRFLRPGLGGLADRIIVLRTAKLEHADLEELLPWRALSPVAGAATELHEKARRDGEGLLQGLAKDIGAEILRRSGFAVIIALVVIGGGIAAAVTLTGGGPGGHRQHHHHHVVPPPARFAVYAWGANAGGDLGDGGTGSAPGDRPVGVRLRAGMTMPATPAAAAGHLAAGPDDSLAVTAAGQVLAWGSNSDGQLGDGTTVSKLAPVNAPMSAGTTVSAVAAGCDQSLALTSAGRVLAWGDNAKGQLARAPRNVAASARPLPVAVPGRATAVSAGCTDGLALAGGKVFGWGANRLGQLGDGSARPSHRPVPVDLPPGVTRIASGCSFGLALTRDGVLYAWGQGSSGQLGDGRRAGAAFVPVRVVIPAALRAGRVTAIAAGCDHALALTSSGKVLAWGSDAAGQLGVAGAHGSLDVPGVVALPPGTVVREICAGADFSLALTSGGRVIAWGADSAGQLGAGPGAGPAPVATDLGGTIVAIGAGPDAEHALAIRAPGRAAA